MYEAAREARSARRSFYLPGSAHATGQRLPDAHKDVGLIDATGGPGAVKAAYSSGKPALGVGPGNTPVYLEKTADLDMAVVDIIPSKTFDNGTICASEQTVVIDDEIYDLVLRKFADAGRAHLQREGSQAAGPHGDRPGDRRSCKRHGGRPEGHRYRPRLRAFA